MTVSIGSLKQGEFSVNRTRNLRVPLGPWAFPLRDLKQAALEAQFAAHNPADPNEAANVLSFGDQLDEEPPEQLPLLGPSSPSDLGPARLQRMTTIQPSE